MPFYVSLYSIERGLLGIVWSRSERNDKPVASFHHMNNIILFSSSCCCHEMHVVTSEVTRFTPFYGDVNNVKRTKCLLYTCTPDLN